MSIATALQHADFESQDSSTVEPDIVWPLIEQVDWAGEIAKMQTLEANRKDFCPPSFYIYREEGGQQRLHLFFNSADDICILIAAAVPKKTFGLIARMGEKEIERHITALPAAKPLVEKFLSLPVDQLIAQVRDDSF